MIKPQAFLLFILLVLYVPLFSDVTLTVRNVIIEGNESLPTRELMSQIRTEPGSYYRQQTAIEDSETIANHYQRRGYYGVKVSYPEAVPVDERRVDVFFRIEESETFRITGFYFQGNSYFSDERIRDFLGISAQGGYSLNFLNYLLEQTVELYASRGYLFAQAELDSLSFSTDGVEAYISIDEGRYSRFENFIFEGNDTTRESTLLRISGLDQMQMFSINRLRQAEENVRRKEYIRDFNLIPINHTTLLLRLEEERMTHLSGMLGYDNSPQRTGSRITGFFRMKFMNLYGTDRDLSFSWRRLTQDRESIEFSYHESGPFAFPVAGDLMIYRETVDSTYIKTTFDTEIYYYTLRNKYGLYFGTDDFFPGTRRPKLIEKSSNKKLGLFWEYNSLDYYLNPRRGMDLEIKHYYILNREEGSWINRQATEIEWDHYTSFDNRVVLLTSFNGKQIENRNLKDYELYSLGGSSDLRGFREEQFSGFRVGWTNVELRYLLTRNSRAFLFADYGVVQLNDGDEVITINDLIGVGFGLRFDTRLGLLGVDYGISHSNKKWLHPLDGMIHFGIEAKL